MKRTRDSGVVEYWVQRFEVGRGYIDVARCETMSEAKWARDNLNYTDSEIK